MARELGDDVRRLEDARRAYPLVRWPEWLVSESGLRAVRWESVREFYVAKGAEGFRVFARLRADETGLPDSLEVGIRPTLEGVTALLRQLAGVQLVADHVVTTSPPAPTQGGVPMSSTDAWLTPMDAACRQREAEQRQKSDMVEADLKRILARKMGGK